MDFLKFYQLLNEKKEHIINRLENLTDEQKKEIIDFFNRKPNLEGKIDWNNKNLTYADFEPIIKERSKTEVKKAVSKSGIAGLVEKQDYVEFPIKSSTDVRAYMPLNYNASRLIASDKIGTCEGKWCTAYQKTNQYWNSYTGRGIVFVYFIMQGLKNENETKYAMAVYPDNETFEVFNANDESVPPTIFYNILEENNGAVNAVSQITKQTKLFDWVREYIKTHRPIEVLTEEDIGELARYCVREILNMRTRNINEKIWTIAKNKVEEVYNSHIIQHWIDVNRPDKNSIMTEMRVKIVDWKVTYNQILEYVGTQYDLAENSLNDKINAFTFCDQENIKDIKEQLLKLRWSKKPPKSYGKITGGYEEMMRLWFNELKIHSFDAIPMEWFEKWLRYNYKNNPSEFEKCKENFVEDFSSAEYFNTGVHVRGDKRVRPYSSILSDKEKEYINNMISKVEKTEYSKNRQQTTLKL